MRGEATHPLLTHLRLNLKDHLNKRALPKKEKKSKVQAKAQASLTFPKKIENKKFEKNHSLKLNSLCQRYKIDFSAPHPLKMPPSAILFSHAWRSKSTMVKNLEIKN